MPLKFRYKSRLLISNSSEERTRHMAYFGKSNDYILTVKLDYVDNESSVVIDFYQIENKLLNKIKTHVVRSDFTINNTLIKVTKLNENKFAIIWSDLFNFEYLQKIYFSFESYSYESNISNKLIHENSFESIWNIYKDQFIISEVFGYNENKIQIRINNLEETTQSSNIFETVKHGYDNREFESSIIDFAINDFAQFVLIKINLEIKEDLLHSKNMKIYMLLQIHFDTLVLCEHCESSIFEPSISNFDTPKIFNKLNI